MWKQVGARFAVKGERQMNNRIRSFVLTLLVVTALCACSNEKEGSGFKKGYSSNNATAASISEASQEKTYVKLEFGKNFSDGLAWVSYSDPNTGEEKTGLLNVDGEILSNDSLSKVDHNEFGSDFSSGYSYVNHRDYNNKTNNSFSIIDEEGNVVVSSPDDGAGYQILAGGDGIFFVYQQILDMKTNEERYGFMDAKGNWIVKPTTENPLKYGYSSDEVLKWGGELFYYYLGEHVFAALVDDYFDYLAIYNVDTGASKYYDNSDLSDTSEIVLTNNNSDRPFTFSNGLSMIIMHDTVCSLNREGEITEIAAIPGGYTGTEIVYYDGIFLLGSVNFMKTWEMRDGVFYDLNGNIVLDMSGYSLAVYGKLNGFYEFHDGIAAVKIVGADGKYYIAHIDKSGNFLYEPIAIDYASNLLGHGSATGGAMYVRYPSDNSAKNCVLLPSGEINEMIDEVEIWPSEYDEAEFSFSCGYAWSEKNCFYIGTDGTILQTYIVQ